MKKKESKKWERKKKEINSKKELNMTKWETERDGKKKERRWNEKINNEKRK